MVRVFGAGALLEGEGLDYTGEPGGEGDILGLIYY